MQEQLVLLIELQKGDSAAGTLTARKTKLPEKIAELEGELAAFTATVEELRKKQEDLTKRQRERESDLKKGQDTLKKAQDRLTEVKTNKEYQAVLKEIEVLKEKNSGTEDDIISALEEADRARGEVTVKEAAFVEYRRRYDEERQKLEEELDSLDAELLARRQKNDEIRKQIGADLLKRYEAIQVVRNGLAVVEVWKEVCRGCHMNIPPQLYNELQKATELISCPNCNRIIYRSNGQSSGQRNGEANG